MDRWSITCAPDRWSVLSSLMEAPAVRRPILFVIKRPKAGIGRTRQAFVVIDTLRHRIPGALEFTGTLTVLQQKSMRRRVRGVFGAISRIGHMVISDTE